jgi:hypothetical protein
LLSNLNYTDDIVEAYRKDNNSDVTKEFRMFDETDPETLFKDFEDNTLDDIMKIKTKSLWKKFDDMSIG